MTRKLTVVPSSAPSPLVRLVDDYLADCLARGLSPRSIKYATGWPLKEIFLPWCADAGIRSVEELDQRTLNKFSAHLQTVGGKKGPLSKASIWTYSKSARRFLSWAKEQGETVPGEVKLNKLDKKLVEVLTPKEIEAMENTATSPRDALIVALFSQTGIRRGELVTLTTRDVIDQQGKAFLRVHGKGSKDRMVPITPSMTRRLKRYIAGRPAEATTTRVFVSLRATPSGEVEALSESGVTQMIGALGLKAKIDRPVFPHLLRHSFATQQLRRGMDSLTLATILGHSSLAMIQQRYSHLAASDTHSALMKTLLAED
jgi:integrase/recombinase XerD